MPNHGVTAGPSRGRARSSRLAKRAQVTVACENCRRSKVKCDGVRPSCSRCRQIEIECTYTVPWSDAPPIIALKRKYSELQRQSADGQALLHQLTSLPQRDAHEVLNRLRTGQDPASALQFALGSPAPITRAERLSPAHRDHNLADGGIIAMPHIRDASIASSTLRSNVSRELITPNTRLPRPNAGASQQLPSFAHLTASIGDSNYIAPQSSRKSMLRKSPSAPEFHHTRGLTSVSVLRIPTWRADSRLDRAYARDWGVFYLEDEAFRNIICSYLIWDHQAWRFFDEDDFLEGLVHAPSISCSPALVHAVIAFGSKNYVWIDAETADASGTAAAAEAERLWNIEHSSDKPLATAAAGLLIWNNNGASGHDNTGEPYILRVKRVADHMNMYDRSSYATKDTKANRAKAIFIWGVYSWLAFCEITLGSEFSLPKSPPDLTPLFKENSADKEWMPWPRSDPRVLALTDEIFLVRCSIMAIFLDIGALQRNHRDSGLTQEYLDASLALCYRLRLVWNSAGVVACSLDQMTPHLLLLHCWYNYAILQLFRPFVTTSTLPSIHSLPLEAAKLSIEPALSTSISAAHQLRSLLTLGSTIFAGLQAPIIFSQVAVAVAVETLPSASALSTTFSPTAGTAFIVALRILYRMGGAFFALRFALLGIKQTALRLHLRVPPEAENIFEKVQEEISRRKTTRRPRAHWVVDLSRSGSDVQAARLESLVGALSDLDLI